MFLLLLINYYNSYIKKHFYNTKNFTNFENICQNQVPPHIRQIYAREGFGPEYASQKNCFIYGPTH